MALAAHAVSFAYPIIGVVTWVITLVVIVVECAAFINCLTQRAEAFQVVGSIPKGGWLALTFGALVLTLLLSTFSIFGMVAVAAALVYLLDVRPALRDAVDGHGSW
jgi:hypothetical protein